MRPAYKAYLFDFDYTLADSSRGIVICFREVLDRHGFGRVTDEAIRRTIGKTLEESFSLLTGETDPGVLSAWRKEYVKAADSHMTVNTRLFPETLTVLRALREAGAKVGIISTKYRYRILELLGQYEPERLLDLVVGGEDVTEPKPSPQGLSLALDRLGLRPDEALYLGDSTVDAETARAAGVDFAGVLHGVTTRAELAAYPHVAIWEDLSPLVTLAKYGGNN